jgi:hypothetical protein
VGVAVGLAVAVGVAEGVEVGIRATRVAEFCAATRVALASTVSCEAAQEDNSMLIKIRALRTTCFCQCRSFKQKQVFR